MHPLIFGIGLNVPLVLFYNWYAHYAFHGKEASGAGPAASGIPPVQDAQPGSVSPSQEASLSGIHFSHAGTGCRQAIRPAV